MDDSGRLKDVILWSKLSTYEFAKTLGYKRAETLYRVLRGQNKISRDLAKRINNIYCIPINWLLFGEGNMIEDEAKIAEPTANYYQTPKETEVEFLRRQLDEKSDYIGMLKMEVDKYRDLLQKCINEINDIKKKK